MTDEQPDTQPGNLTATQRTRVEFAHTDFDAARAIDLMELPQAELILLVERLLGRLGDALNIVDEITRQPSNGT